MKRSHLFDSLSIVVLSTVLHVVPNTVQAQISCAPLVKLLAGDGLAGDNLGQTAALSGDVTVIGAPYGNGVFTGAAYVYRRSGDIWEFEQKLLPSPVGAVDLFGSSVAISGDVIVVGAYFDTGLVGFSGAAYVFRYDGSTWVQEQKLFASNGNAGDAFGSSVAISDDTVIVGALNDDVALGGDIGSAYVFSFDGSTWNQTQLLTPDDGESFDNFGFSVAMFGDAAVIGSIQESEFRLAPGAAYIYRNINSVWTQEATLTANDGEVGDGFGATVAFDGETALIGARNVDVFGPDSGAVYVFRDEVAGWVQEDKLLAADGAEFDRFGISMAVYSGTALIGATGDDDAGLDSGAVYLFRYDGSNWVQQEKAIAADGAAGDLFGSSVALEGTVGVAGAPLHNAQNADAGTAYIFNDVLSTDCNANGVPDSCDLLAIFASASGTLSPIGSGSPQSFTLPDPPTAVGDVSLDFTASADLGSASEWIDVTINGTPLGSVFVATPADDCPLTPDADDLVITAAAFNAAVGTGDAVITMTATADVSSALCLFSYITVNVEYATPDAALDCNTNGVPDECEADCNGNGEADSCDIAGGLSGDCQLNGIPDECELGGGITLLVGSKETDSVIAYDGVTGVLEGDFIAPGAGGLNFPNGLALDEASFLYVASVESDSIIKYAVQNGEPVLEISGGGMDAPVGLLLRDPNRLLAASYGTDSILEFDTDTGAFLSTLVASGAGGLDGPGSILPTPGGTLLIPSFRSDQVLEFDGLTGAFIRVAAEGGGLNGPADVLLDSDGNLLVTSIVTNSVLHYAPDGTFLGEFVSGGSGGLSGPEIMTFGPDGNLYVTSFYTSQVLEYDGGDGSFVGVFASGGGLNQPTYLIFADFTKDCNANGIPDACDSDGESQDCNGNLIPDDCDLSSGLANDCNANLVLDACEFSGAGRQNASDAEALDEYGQAVAAYGDLAVVGAYFDDDLGADSGSAYVLRFNGTSWQEVAKLTASDGAAGDNFGVSVAAGDDLVVVGAVLDDHVAADAGAAYVFRFDGSNWVEEAKLVNSNAALNDHFGRSVSLHDNVIVVGSPLDDDAASNSGSAYVFRYNGSTWVQEAKLAASDASSTDYFGWAVSVDGDTALIGAFLDDPMGADSGSAYVFRYTGSSWVQEQKLTSSDGIGGDSFGRSVSVSGDVAAVGAYLHDAGAADSGAAYVFRKNSTSGVWVQEAKLTPADPSVSKSYGFSVAIEFDHLLVGAYRDGEGGADAGAAYTYRSQGSDWFEQAKLTAYDAEPGDAFGRAVALDADRAVIGSYHDDGPATDNGSVYFFSGGGPDCNVNGILDACDLSAGTSADCQNNGVPDECEIASGTSADINNNDVPDECETAVMSCASVAPNGVPNGSASVEVYVAGVEDLNAYQVQVDTVTITGPGVLNFSTCVVEDDRDDFVFQGLNPFVVCSANDQEVAVVASGSQTADVPEDAPAYLATFVFEISGDATEESQFEVRIEPSPDSFLADELSILLPFSIEPPCAIGVIECAAPVVVAEGGRYLQVSLEPATVELASAIQIGSPDCPELLTYVDADGCLSDSPVFQTASEWGTVHVTGVDIVPEYTYEVTVLCKDATAPGASSSATTWVWGDVGSAGGGGPDDDVDVIDIQKVLQCAEGTFNPPTTVYNTDLVTNCPGAGCDIFDVFGVADAFTGLSYSGPEPCGDGLVPSGGPRGVSAELTLVPILADLDPCVGSTFTVEAFIQDVADLRGYQIQLTFSGGESGSLSCGNLSIDTERSDYVFQDAPSDDLIFVNESLCRLSSSLISGGVVVGSAPMYLGTFEAVASADADGEFTASYDLRDNATVLLDSLGVAVEFTAGDAALTVAACPGDANCDREVDPLDSGFVLSRFGCAVNAGDPDCDASDQNGDGNVDPLDVGFVLSRFGECG